MINLAQRRLQASQNFTIRAGVEQELCGIIGSSENMWLRETQPVQKHLIFGEKGIELPSRLTKPSTAFEDTFTEDGIANQPHVVIDDIDPDEVSFSPLFLKVYDLSWMRMWLASRWKRTVLFSIICFSLVQLLFRSIQLRLWSEM